MSKYDYGVIVVGTDGSPLARPTVARAAWLASHDDADLVIVCAYTDLPRRQEARNPATLGGDARFGEVQGRAAANDALTSAVAIAAEQGATVKAALLVKGDPSAALLQAVADHSADLLVIGAVHDVSIAERLLGTVASEVVKRAPSEVLIVRPRPDSPDGPVPEGDQDVPESGPTG
ncbi:universal stress protein [Actinomycetota bacterium]